MVKNMASTITLGFNIFCGVLLLSGILWGLIRGVKKTISRFLFLLLTSVILLFVTAPIVKSLLAIPVSVTMNINDTTIEGTMTIMEVISNIVKAFLGESFVSNNPEFTELIISLPIILANAFVYLILFWVSKIVLLPLNALITLLIFPKRRKRADVMGFALGNDERPEYPNSDKSIDPLMDIYKNSQNAPDKPEAGVFIKKENEIGNDTPTASHIRAPEEVEEPVQEISKKQIKKEKKAEKKAIKKEKKALKPKKYRLWGAFAGFFVGIVIIFNTMIPVYGIMNIMSTHNYTQFKNFSDEPFSLDTLTDGMTGEIIEGYELSVLGRLSKFLEFESLGLSGFDHLTTAKVKDKEIVLRKDVNSIISTATKVDNLIGLCVSADLDTITQEELTAIITTAEDVITSCEQIGFIEVASPYILPIAYEILKDNNIHIVENEYANELILDTIESIASNAGINIFEELKAVLNVAKYLNDQQLLIRIVTNNYDNILTTINNLEPEFGTNLTSKLFAIKTIDTAFPNAINIGLSLFDDMVHFGYVENTSSEAEIKSSFTSFINNLVDTARTLSKESQIYVTDNTLVPLGKTLDTLRNSKLFNLETYNNLLDYTLTQVKTMTGNLIPENYKDIFNNQLLRNVSDVTSWENEMSVISDTLKILRDKEYGILGNVVAEEPLRVGYTFNIKFTEETFINIGKAFDKLETSTLLGSIRNYDTDGSDYNNTTITNMFSCILSELQTEFSNDDNTKEILEIVDLMKVNIAKAEHSISSETVSTFWEDELTAVSPLIIYVSDIVNGGDVELSSELGRILDTCAHDSIMMGGNTTLKLMEKFIIIAEDAILGEYTPAEDNSIEDATYFLLQDIKTSLNSTETEAILASTEDFWTQEIDYFNVLLDIAEDAEDLNDINSAQSIASDLDYVYSSNIIPDTSINNTIASILRSLKTSANSGVEGQINVLIEDIATDITTEDFFENKEKENFWQIEFEHITSLNNVKFEDDIENDYKVLDNLTKIGETIDVIVYGNDDIRSSYLITEPRVRKILSTAINEMTSTISNSFDNELQDGIENAIEKISKNIYNSEADTQIQINSFKEEFTHLQNLAHLDIDSSYFVYSQGTNISILQERLVSLGENLDNIAFNNETANNITSYQESKNSKFITRNIIGDIIISAFTTAKISSPSQTIDNAFNELIDNIQASIKNTIAANKLISWSRELSYVSTLIQLNSGETVTLDNVTSITTPYLDKIAFNSKDNTFADILFTEVKDTSNNILGYNVIGNIDELDSTQYNSVIISRNMIKTLIDSILSDFKIDGTNLSDENKLSNELIDNMSSRINTAETTIQTPPAPASLSETLFNNYTEAFGELKSVKDTMEAKAESLNGKTLNSFTKDDLEQIDIMLTNFQETKISGIGTTRKIAIMILDKIDTIIHNDVTNLTLEPVIVLLNRIEELKTHYNSSTNKEVYYFEESTTNEFANPFTSLFDSLSIIQTLTV